jgi:nucleoside-triphosphatase
VPARLLIESRPGAGKTTALSRLAERLRDDGVALSGFLTREMRSGGRRVGFEIETFGGERGLLAHAGLSGPPRVGRYGVDLEEFERLALPSLEAPADVVLIDELGKMELASERFQSAMSALFDGDVPIVATVHTFQHPFTDALKDRADVTTIRLTRANRDGLPEELAERLRNLPDVPG